MHYRRSVRRRLPHISLLALAVLAPAIGCATPSALARHVSAGCGEGRRIALTFDDGPNPPYTQRILDILTARHVHATFFDEGEAVDAHPEIVRQERDAGMAIGSHSYTHSDTFPTVPRAEFAQDVARAERSLTDALALRPAMYRAPYGHTSASMLAALREAGYASIGWDVDSADWSDASAAAVVANVLAGAHAGAIVLMHDGGLGGGNPQRDITIQALPRIIDELSAQGYQLVTVPALTGLPELQGQSPGSLCLAN